VQCMYGTICTRQCKLGLEPNSSSDSDGFPLAVWHPACHVYKSRASPCVGCARDVPTVFHSDVLLKDSQEIEKAGG
jgi:hypothetical protein